MPDCCHITFIIIIEYQIYIALILNKSSVQYFQYTTVQSILVNIHILAHIFHNALVICDMFFSLFFLASKMNYQTLESPNITTSDALVVVKEEHEDDSSDAVGNQSTEGSDKKKLDIPTNYVTPNITNQYQLPEIKSEMESSDSDCRQDSNLTRDHLPATTNIVQDDDELNQLTEVAGEMDCKDGIKNGNSNHLLVGRVISTDVEGKDQEQLARDLECSDDSDREGW